MRAPAPNLLAFSGGVDSSALFFWLIERGVPFDIALVNYKTRPESDLEMEWALQLGERYRKRVYIHLCPLPRFSELEARRCRYQFFEEVIRLYRYRRLILGHQLNDRLEWLLMELGRGAGVVEMVGMEEWEERGGYQIWRPFAFWSRGEILEYLHRRNLPYFQDRTNFQLDRLRNRIRHRFATPFIEEFREGVKRSFKYLERDKHHLLPVELVRQLGHCYLFPELDPHRTLRLVDHFAKRLGVVMSSRQREELLRTDFNGVIGGKVAVGKGGGWVYLAPFVKIGPISPEKGERRRLRELCRRLKVPPKVRGYLLKEGLCGMLSMVISTAAWRSGLNSEN
jgi:tRNA(Ile)-lysidine synthase